MKNLNVNPLIHWDRCQEGNFTAKTDFTGKIKIYKSKTFSYVFNNVLFQTVEYTQAVACVTDRQNQDKALTQAFILQDFTSVHFKDLAIFNSVLCQGGKISKLMFIVTALWWNLSKLVCMFAEVWCSRLATGLSLKLGRVNDFMCHTCLFKCPVTMLIELQKFYSI